MTIHDALPDDLKEAISLFEAYEKSRDHESRIRNFQGAVEAIDFFIEDNPNSPHLERAKNLKLSYARSLIRFIGQYTHSDEGYWVRYVFLVLFRLEDVKELAFQHDPDLKEPWERFLAVRKEQLKEALLHIEREEKKRESKRQ